MSKFCIHCGKAVDEYATVCMNCGCEIKSKKKKRIVSKEEKVGSRLMSVGVLFCYFPYIMCIYNMINSKLAFLGMLIGLLLVSIGIYFWYKAYSNFGEKRILVAVICGIVILILSLMLMISLIMFDYYAYNIFDYV